MWPVLYMSSWMCACSFCSFEQQRIKNAHLWELVTHQTRASVWKANTNLMFLQTEYYERHTQKLQKQIEDQQQLILQLEAKLSAARQPSGWWDTITSLHMLTRSQAVKNCKNKTKKQACIVMNLFNLALLYMTELLHFYCFGSSGEMKCEPCNHLLDEASVFRKKLFPVCHSPPVYAKIAIWGLKKQVLLHSYT